MSTYTRAELERMLGRASSESTAAARSHHAAVEATTSMAGQSARRAHARNRVAAAGDRAIAISGALEIHDLFPEHALGEREAAVAELPAAVDGDVAEAVA